LEIGKQRGLRKQVAGPIAQRKVPTQRKGTRGKQAMSKSLPLSLPNAAFVVVLMSNTTFKESLSPPTAADVAVPGPKRLFFMSTFRFIMQMA